MNGGSPAASLVEPAEVAAALGLPPPTPEQAAVVAAPIEPGLVVAGAGAGKTETMAARVVWLVANGLVLPEQVLGLTFTRKAARQLAERVRARLRRLAGSDLLDRIDPGGARRASVLAGEPTVLTYHAYAGRLLAEHGLRLPVQPGSRMLSQTSSWQLAHRVVASWEGDLETDRAPASVTAQLLALAGELAEHLVRPEDLAGYTERICRLIETAPRAKGQREGLPQDLQKIVAAQRFRLELLPLVEGYQQRKRTEGALDFADQMSLAAQLAAGHPAAVQGERDRYRAVLLDEYQDTGHAQRVLLRSLFGGPEHPPLPVTAVGDPAQAIYGWRGASAANLPRFTTDFPRMQAGKRLPARDFGLLTSFRNPPQVLTLANAIAEPLRAGGLGVAQLRARPGAPDADIVCALLPDVRAEREWLAGSVAERWYAELERSGAPPTAAVLVRRRADMAPIAAELRARGLPVEVVGIGGLLDEPEVADLVSTLRLLVDPLAGTAAARLLTGARWRLAAADLAALWRRAATLSGEVGAASDDPLRMPEKAEQTGLADALDDPGDRELYSVEGYRRLGRLSRELSLLRRRLDQSLPELVADVERTMLLDIESRARPGAAGRAHLDAFAGVVADYAETASTASLLSFVDYLSTAAHAEDGLAPGEVEVAADRVQVLTAHSAKGLEWQVVAVPHLVVDVFPGKRRSASWLRTATALPATLRGDSADLPSLAIGEGWDRKEIVESLALHEQGFAERQAEEERRLCYVALTRSEHALLLSGHWWNETSTTPRGPSEFLRQLAGVLEREQDLPIGTVVTWAEAPEPDAENPLLTEMRTAQWPIDPLGDRRTEVTEGAGLVRAALTALRQAPEAVPAVSLAAARPEMPAPQGDLSSAVVGAEDEVPLPPEPADEEEPPYPEEPPPEDEPPPLDEPEPPEPELPEHEVVGTEHPRLFPGEPEQAGVADPDGWIADTDVLLAERFQVTSAGDEVLLPEQLSVSQLVQLAEDPAELASKLRRPLPAEPSTYARRGTAFHGWLERRFGAQRLLEIDELPGAADTDAAEDGDLSALQAAFERSEWSARTPHDVEVPFSAEIEGVTVRGRMDAVFADEDGGWTVVDWKTGAVPDQDRLRLLSVQLAAYRLAWSALHEVPLERVRAVFHYIRTDRTVRPVDLLDAEGLRALLRTVPPG